MSTYTPLPGAGGGDPALDARVTELETQIAGDIVPNLLDDKHTVPAVAVSAIITGIEPFEPTDVITVADPWTLFMGVYGAAPAYATQFVQIPAATDVTVAAYLATIQATVRAGSTIPGSGAFTAALDEDGAIQLVHPATAAKFIGLGVSDIGGAVSHLGLINATIAEGSYTPPRLFETSVERISVEIDGDEVPVSEVFAPAGNKKMLDTAAFPSSSAASIIAWHPSLADGNYAAIMARVIVGGGMFVDGVDALKVSRTLTDETVDEFTYTPAVGDTIADLASAISTHYAGAVELEVATGTYIAIRSSNAATASLNVQDLSVGQTLLTEVLGFQAFQASDRSIAFLPASSISAVAFGVGGEGGGIVNVESLIGFMSMRIADLEARLQAVETP